MSKRRDFIKKSIAMGAGAAIGVGSAQASPSESNHKLRFAIASDGHYGQPDTPYEMYHNEMMAWLNEEAGAKGLDFVVFNGDLIHDEPKFLPEVKAVYEKLEVPFYVTKGNHDRVSPEVWKTTWGYAQNHSFKIEEYAFILGTTSNIKGEYLCGDVTWIKGELEKHKDASAVFVFLHIPQSKWANYGVECPELNELLQKAENVKAVFHGHNHELDNVFVGNELSYFFDGHIGGSWGTNYRGYRIVEINEEGNIQTYQCNPQAFKVNKAKL
ncbi:metallophosphoesterase [Flammeovirgaceae bacterium SG7u.111]|nr:metallophosphoesterase [Flammeovirgaceae bacterium SG7u.132]WPO38212.1 metallophosphoesterase [Flammeovirgaceae bacterium SG7u.111]